MTAPHTSTLPVGRTCSHAPPEEHRRLQKEAPISRVLLPSGMTAWVLTRHEDIRTMLTDPRFSSDRGAPGYPYVKQRPELEDGGAISLSLLGMDPPEHGPARRAVAGEFTVKQLNAMRPRIQEIVDERVDAMLAGPRPVDLVQALSLPVPSLVICELLGVPYADHEFFQTRSALLLSWSSTPEQRTTAFMELLDYLDRLLTLKKEKPADDLLSRQVAESDSIQQVKELALLLLVAGHETTANMISLGAMALLERPGDVRTILEDPSKTPMAVEELLRYFTITEFGSSRVAVADVEIGGVLIRAGEGVVTLLNTANRDPEVFERPDELDIERGARNHLSFGFGPHQCLGQNLARMELEIVFNTLFRRIPGLRPAVPVDTLPIKDATVVYGLDEFPVTWDQPEEQAVPG